MHSAYDAGGNQLFKLVEILQRHDLFMDRMNPAVVPHSFDVDDFIEHDLFQTVFCLDEDKFRRCISGMASYVALSLVDSLEESVEVEGL